MKRFLSWCLFSFITFTWVFGVGLGVTMWLSFRWPIVAAGYMFLFFVVSYAFIAYKFDIALDG